MASVQADTNVDGEQDPQAELRNWMIDNNIKLSDSTYSKLRENEFFTIDDLRHITPPQMEEYVKPNEMNIKLVDRSKLIHASKILSQKKNFIDPEELNYVNKMQLMLKTFEANLERLVNKQQSIKSQKEKMKAEINQSFDLLITTINERRNALLAELNRMIAHKNELMDTKLKQFNKSLQITHDLEVQSNKLLNTAIDIKELNERTTKIKENQQQIKRVIDDTNRKDKETVIQDQLFFVIDTNNALKFLSRLGCISEITAPVLVQLEYDDNHPNGEIKVLWKTEEQKQENTGDSSRKLRLEYMKTDEDQQQNEMEEKSAVSKDIEIGDKIDGNETISVDNIGVYMVRLKHFKNKQWSKYSNIKSIKISQIMSMGESVILSIEERKELFAMVSPHILSTTNHTNARIKLSLLYRWSTNGKNAKSFHDACDNKGATLIVIQSNYNHVFGGYATTSWTSSGNGTRDENSFLYLLRSQFGHQKQIYKVKDNSVDNAVYHLKTDGPSFGSSCSLKVNYNDNPDSNYCYHDQQYPIIGNALCGGDSFKETGTTHSFTLKDYEVFSVLVS